MINRDLVRQNGESTNSLGRVTGNTEEYPSFPNLYREMTNWMSDWDNLLGEFFGPRWNWQSRPTLAFSTLSDATHFAPPVDIREGDNGYMVTAELPGIDPKEVEITVQEGTLLIKGEKKLEHEHKGEGYHRMERSYGSFRRAILLSKGRFDLDHIDADLQQWPATSYSQAAGKKAIGAKIETSRRISRARLSQASQAGARRTSDPGQSEERKRWGTGNGAEERACYGKTIRATRRPHLLQGLAAPPLPNREGLFLVN